jgi:methylated-DNA-[protein]-cysteine S-methyltransferase
MAIIGGSCRFGLWFVHVWWNENTVYQVRFATTGLSGPVPPLLRKFCIGQPVDLLLLNSIATETDTLFGRIYSLVRWVPYGSTATYGEIARRAGTAPRVVGQAMARNPTPLVVPCHRIVGAHGIGGFSPSPEIKEALLLMEKKTVLRTKRKRKS